jgi:hypothetical protein
MGKEEEGIGPREKERHGIAVSKGFYSYQDQNLSEAPAEGRGFASVIYTLCIERDPQTRTE